jgi:hypothetical protein
MSAIGTLAHEFPDYPADSLPAIPADWEPQHWHNDACPSWNAGRGMSVYVDYADQEMRECGGDNRYCVLQESMDDCSPDCWLSTDSWTDVLAFVNYDRAGE